MWCGIKFYTMEGRVVETKKIYIGKGIRKNQLSHKWIGVRNIARQPVAGHNLLITYSRISIPFIIFLFYKFTLPISNVFKWNSP